MDKELLCHKGSLGVLLLMTMMGHPRPVRYAPFWLLMVQRYLSAHGELQKMIHEMNRLLLGMICSRQVLSVGKYQR